MSGLPRALRRVIKALLPERRSEQPIDLNAFARSLGAVDILYAGAHRFHGYTDWTARGPIIHLHTSRTHGRRRFTLGHECGHLLFDPARQRGPGTTMPHDANLELTSDIRELRQRFEIERLCDMFTVEMLLPHDEMRRIARACSSLPKLIDYADTYQVSLSMMAFRANEFHADLALLRLRRSITDKWVVVDRIGLPTALARLEELPHRTLCILDGLPVSEMYEFDIGLHNETENATVPAQILRGKTSMLIAFRRSRVSQGSLDSIPARSDVNGSGLPASTPAAALGHETHEVGTG